MKKLKPILIAGICSISIFCLSGIVSAKDTSFSDVSQDYWAYSDIQWAISHNVTFGYPDGTFKPDQAVSQSEWYAMLIRAYQPSDFSPESNASAWDTPYQEYATKFGWESSATDESQLTRGNVAQYLAEASGKHFNIDDSILYILDMGLSEGKIAKTIAGFEKNDAVSRAEAVAFIKRFEQKFSELSASPSDAEKYMRSYESIVYQNPKYKFSLQLPESWNGKYEVEERNYDYPDGHVDSILFISKANKSWGGVLFNILLQPKAMWDAEEDDMLKNGHIAKIGERDGIVFTLGTPHDVEYNINNDIAKEEYSELFNSIKDIQVTFTFQ